MLAWAFYLPRRGSNLPGRPPALSKWKVRKPSPPSRSKLRLRPMISTCRLGKAMVQGCSRHLVWILANSCKEHAEIWIPSSADQISTSLGRSVFIHSTLGPPRSQKPWSPKAGQHYVAHLLASCKRCQSPRLQYLTIIQRSFSKGKLLRNERNHT